MAAAPTDWQELNLNTIADALPEAMIIRVTTRRGRRTPHNPHRPSLNAGPRGLPRGLKHQYRHYLDLAEVTAVDIIGIYLKDYEG